MTNITFERASFKHKDTIFSWLAEPHMVEFWDNSQEHKNDIINFIDGRKVKSTYFNGIFTYWIGSINGKPYSLIMSAEVTGDENDLWKAYASKTGKTISIDFGIGNKDFLGKGLAASTIEAFCQFYQLEIDEEADTFFIDPDAENPRATHVYDKAGFKKVGEYEMQNGVFKGSNTFLMVKKLTHKPQIIQATIKDYPVIQNMARYYVYDRSGFMGWGCEEDGSFECIDFKHYFDDPKKLAFLIKVENELAGFVLLDKETILEKVDWNIGEFFILAKFQGKGVASFVAKEILQKYYGKWSVAVMPQNIKAVKFWRKIINSLTNGNFICNFRSATNSDEYDMDVFEFEVKM